MAGYRRGISSHSCISISTPAQKTASDLTQYMSPIDSQYYKSKKLFLVNDKVTDQSKTDDNHTTAGPPTKRPKIL
ncbi:hypothetical protein DPMN_159395 [Dreissena polymorpha]|uniref:Uncharacterized protein n=1 Tax=Dreissena polymorpha TaxID=45954 RepID=A0A9D4IQP3_DREPO|nr:hypothetical protein DPMN_159395 [Dreissena polymorpha]